MLKKHKTKQTDIDDTFQYLKMDFFHIDGTFE